MRVTLFKLLMRGKMHTHPLTEPLRMLLKTVSLKMYQNVSAHSKC